MLLFKRMILRGALVILASTPLCRAEVPVEVTGQFTNMATPSVMITGRDGLLYGVGANKKGGVVYRVVPGGMLHILHQFLRLPSAPDINQGGADPTDKFLMAEDGSLYGLTGNGGRYGQGVLYRVLTNGNFSVLGDLNSDTLPSGTVAGAYFVNEGRCFLEGPDHAFYLSQPDTGAVVRIGRDGALSVAGQTGQAYQVLRDPAQPYHMLAVTVRQPPYGGPYSPVYWGIRIRRFSIPEGTVVEDISGPLFDAAFYSPAALQWTAQGLLVSASWRNDSEGRSTRMFRVNLDGSMSPLADFAGSGDSPLPPDMEQFVRATDDGTIYYTAGYAEEGDVGGGTTLVELKPDGQFRTVCGFGKCALYATTQGTDHTLFGASYGNKIYVPLDDSGYSMNWMDESNAGNFETINHPGNRGMFVRIALDGNAVPGSASGGH